MLVIGQRPPVVNLDAIPREITVKAGRRVDLEIPYTGKFVFFRFFNNSNLIIGVSLSNKCVDISRN